MESGTSEERKYCVYLITNLVNGKQYAGQTGQSVQRRWNSHKAESRRGLGIRFYNAMRKYGEENFAVCVVREGLTKDEVDREEVLWIRSLCLTEPDFGYNLKEGGAHGGHNEATRKKQSEKALERRSDIPLSEIVSLYSGGASLTKIGERFKATHHSIARRLRSAGITIRSYSESGILSQGLSSLDNDVIVEMYRSGVDSVEIAEKFGAHPTTIRQRIRDSGDPVRSKSEAQTLRRGIGMEKEAAELYRGGLSLTDIGKRFGVSAAAVRYRLKKMGEPRRTISEAALLFRSKTKEQNVQPQI